MIDKKKESL